MTESSQAGDTDGEATVNQTTTTEPVVRVCGLMKEFRRADGARVPAIDGVTVEVYPGEFVVLLGPSGCGKTTLLNSITGLERPDRGVIEIKGDVVFSDEQKIDVRTERRRVSMVFQSYALWPHMNVFANVAFPLQCQARRTSKSEIRAKVQRVLDLVGIGDLSNQYPNQMSGGQQQRAALARALVAGSDLVLFDEPLSNVDAKVREQLRLELLSMQRDLGFSAVFVTHDQQEAMALAHRILVMEKGRVAQSGTAEAIYESPASRYVANFIGSSNEVTGRVTAAHGTDGVVIQTAFGPIRSTVAGTAAQVGDEVVALWRPERSRVTVEEPQAPNRWPLSLQTSLFLGAHTEHVVRAGDDLFQTWVGGRERIDPGTDVWLSVLPEAVHIFPATAPVDGQVAGDEDEDSTEEIGPTVSAAVETLMADGGDRTARP